MTGQAADEDGALVDTRTHHGGVGADVANALADLAMSNCRRAPSPNLAEWYRLEFLCGRGKPIGSGSSALGSGASVS
jgi:hypothetical protein